jgi:hypothetical protein
MQSEHIYIGDEFADTGEPETVNSERTVRNCINGAITKLTFYDEGFLGVCEIRKGSRRREHTLELCFLAPKLYSKTYAATPFLWAALATGVLALISSFFLPTTPYASHSLTATVVMSALATLSLLLFVYRSEVRFQIRTAVGQAVVLSLVGSFGCIRKTRSAARAIVMAIRESRAEKNTRDISYLRAEMRAHYKLAETGVISREACSDCTTQILSRFG